MKTKSVLLAAAAAFATAGVSAPVFAAPVVKPVPVKYAPVAKYTPKPPVCPPRIPPSRS